MRKIVAFLSLLLLANPAFAWFGGSTGPTPAPVVLSTTPSWYDYAAYGDSLTSGNEDATGVSYPNALQQLVGASRTVYNYGVGGQTSTQIAIRTGSVSTTATITGSSIPASGSVAVSFTAGQEPATIQGEIIGNTQTIGIHGTLGTVPGLITTPDGSTFTFTRDVSGVAVSGATAPFTVDKRSSSAFNILWVGRNNISPLSTIKTDLSNIVSSLTSSRYLVLSILNAENEPSGSANYNTIIADNAGLASTYPNNTLDIRSYLVSQYNAGNALDVIDHTNDIPPASLRAVDVAGSLNGAINNSTCTINLTNTTNSIVVGNIMLVDSEYIYVSATSGGTQVTGCTRGYGSTSAASHLNGAAYTAIDPIHLNAAGYRLVASYINSWLTTNDTNPSGGGVVTASGTPSLFASPPAIGTFTPNAGYFSYLGVNTPYAQAPLHINSQGTAILLGQGNNSGQVSTQFVQDNTANGTMSITTYKQGGGYGNVRIQGNGGNVGIGPLGAGYPLTVSGASADVAYFSATAGFNTNFNLDTATAGKQASFSLKDAGVSKWQFGKNTDNTLFAYDAVNARNLFASNGFGDLTILPGGSGGAVVGTTALASGAILQADSTTKGFLPPRMTTTQKNAITSPATGLIVFDTTLNKLCVYTGAAWQTITSI